MNVLLLYGTTEGQTGKIARFVTERLVQDGQKALMIEARESAFIPDLGEFDAVLIAASLHAGRFQREVIEFVKHNRQALAEKSSALLSVSLSAAGRDPQDVVGLATCVAQFIEQTGWTPGRVHHVAGALRYSAYGLITRWVMRHIAARRGAPTDTRRDYELTDWQDLARFIDEFAATSGVTAAARPAQ